MSPRANHGHDPGARPLERDHLAERIQPDRSSRRRRSPARRLLRPWLLGLVALGAFGGGLAFALSGSSQETTTSPPDTADPTTAGTTGPTDPTEPPGGAVEGESGGNGAAVATTATAPPLTDPTIDPNLPHLQARLDLEADPADGVFSVIGRLPPGPEHDAVQGAVALAYAPLQVSEIEADPAAANEPWMAAAPRILPLLGLTSGATVTLDGNGLRLEGTVGQTATAEMLAGTIQQIWEAAGARGTVDTAGLQVSGLDHPSASIEVADGAATLRGAVPEARLAEQLAEATIAIYGADNVDNGIQVDDSTYEALWMYTLPAFLPRFEPFPAYEIVLTRGTISGRVDSDGLYAVDSVQPSEDAQLILLVAASVLTRDPRLVMTIEGHTDSTGPDDYNLDLSQRRANAAADALVALGIDRSRLTAEGRGEEEPVADNDTVEGRAANRRAEFSFGLADDPAG